MKKLLGFIFILFCFSVYSQTEWQLGGISSNTGMFNQDIHRITLHTSSPTVNDDIDSGYTVGSNWVNTSIDTAYICMDNTDGAAIWTIINGGNGGAGVADSSFVKIFVDTIQGLNSDTVFMNSPLFMDGDIFDQNSPALIQFNSLADNDVVISSDNGGLSEGWLWIGSSSVKMMGGTGVSAAITANKKGVFGATSAFTDVLFGVGDTIGQLRFVDNFSGAAHSWDYIAPATFLSTQYSTINSGVTGTVIIGGDSLVGKTDNVVYVPNLGFYESGTIEGLLTNATLTADRAWTLPDASGTIMLEGQAADSAFVKVSADTIQGLNTDSTLFTGTAIFEDSILIKTTNGIDYMPGSDIDMDLATLGVTGTPRFYWDESDGAFTFTTSDVGGRLNFIGATGDDCMIRFYEGATLKGTIHQELGGTEPMRFRVAANWIMDMESDGEFKIYDNGEIDPSVTAGSVSVWVEDAVGAGTDSWNMKTEDGTTITLATNSLMSNLTLDSISATHYDGITKEFGFAGEDIDSSITADTIPIFFVASAEFNGYDITDAIAGCYTTGSGTATIQLVRRRAGSNVDVFSTGLTLTNEYYVSDEVINTSNDDIQTGDAFFCIVTGSTATAAKGLTVVITCTKP